MYSIWTIVNISRLKFGPPKSIFLATPLRIEARSMVFTTRLVVDDLREDLGRKWEERLVLRLVSVGGQKHLIDVLNKNSWSTQLISKKWERRIHNEKNKKLIKDKKIVELCVYVWRNDVSVVQKGILSVRYKWKVPTLFLSLVLAQVLFFFWILFPIVILLL